MPRHPHEPVTPTLPFPPVPPEPPCGCRPPRMRPEPFSPGGLPAPHGFDFGRWAREKINWLLSLVPSAASVDNPLADREWVTGQAVGGKADKVAGAAEGNLAALAQDGNLADSGAKPADFATAAQGAKADTAVQPAAIAGFVDGAGYDAEYGDPPKPTILLKHGSEVVATVDAADFVIDGMVSNVEVKNGNLVITFNTDSGKQPISIPLTDIFDPANYYTKTDVDGLLAGKASKADATLTFSPWRCVPAELTDPLTSQKLSLEVRYEDNAWELLVVGGSGDPIATVTPGDPDATSLVFDFVWNFEPTTVTATRAYQLGDQSDKPLASEAEAEALRQGKQDALTFDNAPTSGSNNPVKSSGIWAAIWGALSALPTGFASLYDWCVAQLAGKQPLFTVYATSGTIIKTILTFVKDGSLMKPIEIPTSNTTVNGKPLTDDVTLTGADIAVSDSDATKINAALTGKLDKSGGTMTGEFGVGASVQSNFQVTPEISSPSDYTPPIMWFGDGAGVGIIWRTENGRVEVDVSDISGATYRIAWPSASGTLALAALNPTAGNLAALDANGNPVDSGVKPSDKLDSTSAAPAFSPDPSVSYAVGSHCTYQGKLYKCTTATTGGTWVAGSWTADAITDPDAVLDITVQNQLRVVAKDGTLLWAQGYDLASTSSATLACDATNNFTFADGATTQAFTLPTAPTGKVGDFGLDIDNSTNASAATMTLTGLDSTFSVVVPEGESLNDMLAIAAGELARFYISLSTFRVNNLPTWHILKQVVENGGATV